LALEVLVLAQFPGAGAHHQAGCAVVEAEIDEVVGGTIGDHHALPAEVFAREQVDLAGRGGLACEGGRQQESGSQGILHNKNLRFGHPKHFNAAQSPLDYLTL
jgi:hypothetical protein